MKKLLLIVGGIIIFIIILVIISGGGDKKEIQKLSDQEYTTAYKLASLQSNKRIGTTIPSPELKDEFEKILISLNRKCTEGNKEKIGNYIYKSQEMFTQKGVDLTLLEIATLIDESIPEDVDSLVSCAEIAAMLVMLTESE